MAAPAPSRSLVESLIRQTLYAQIGREDLTVKAPPVLVVNSSARHMHVSPENMEVLFGKGYQLQVHKWLYQEGQYASTATVTFKITSNDYRSDGPWTYSAGAGATVSEYFDAVANQGGWYDFTVTVSSDSSWSRRCTGHIETGSASVSG